MKQGWDVQNGGSYSQKAKVPSTINTKGTHKPSTNSSKGYETRAVPVATGQGSFNSR